MLKVLIIDNFLSDKDCNNLINLFKKSKIKKEFRDTLVVTIKNNKLQNKLNMMAQEFNGSETDWYQIVEWPKNSSQLLHVDDFYNHTTLSSVLYLNDDYEGGETFFKDGTIVKPKRGRILVFDGLKYYHGVKQVTKGTRYASPCWYKKI